MAIAETLTAMQPPVRLEPDGSLRIGDTRVLLEAVVYLYREGADALGIVDAYPALSLAEVHGAIAYYLNHVDEVEAYLAEREAKGDEMRRLIEERYPTADLRNQLRARRADLARRNDDLPRG